MLPIAVSLPQGTCRSDLSASVQLTGRHSDPAHLLMAAEKGLHTSVPSMMPAKASKTRVFLLSFLTRSAPLFYKST